MDVVNFDSESGIKVASYTEIREALQEDLKRVFGSTLNLAPSTPDGMLVDVFCYAFNAIAQNLQGVITNLNVSTASGIFLDYLAQIAVGGRNDDETDEDLIKRIQSAEHYGYATYNGMLTYLRAKIGGNTGLQVNETPNTVGGLTPYSFAVIVPESCTLSNDEIAAYIWECKPAGIKACGVYSGSVTSYGQTFTVFFNRVSMVTLYLQITISEYEEESLPAEYATDIKTAVVNWAAEEYRNGKDIILQRITVPVFSVPGILSVTVKAKTSASGTWSDAARIPLNANQYASVSAENIEVLRK